MPTRWLEILIERALGKMLAPIMQKLTQLEGILNNMADTIQQENDAISAVEAAVQKLGADLLAEINSFKAALAAGVDTTPQVNRLTAVATAISNLDATAVAAEPAPAVSASPVSLALNASNPSQVVTLTGVVGSVTAVSANPAVATVTTSVPFTVAAVAPGTVASTNVTFTDSATPANVVTVPVSVS